MLSDSDAPRNECEAVQRILRRIAASKSYYRGRALDGRIMDHEVLGRERKRRVAIGREGGERIVILRQISKRFGSVPDWAKQRLDGLSPSELEQVEPRLLDAPTLQALFG